jgi:hypothetical protein
MEVDPVCSGCRVHVSHACFTHGRSCMQVDAKIGSVKNVLKRGSARKRNAVALAPRTGCLPTGAQLQGFFHVLGCEVGVVSGISLPFTTRHCYKQNSPARYVPFFSPKGENNTPDGYVVPGPGTLLRGNAKARLLSHRTHEYTIVVRPSI